MKDGRMIIKLGIMLVLVFGAVVSWSSLVRRPFLESQRLTSWTQDQSGSEVLGSITRQRDAIPVSPAVPSTLSDSLIDRHVVVSAVEYSYKVGGTIMVTPGENVRILFENNGTSPHDLTIPDLGVTTGVINPGQSISIDVPIPEELVSNYVFYSSIGDDRALGLEGHLVVQVN